MTTLVQEGTDRRQVILDRAAELFAARGVQSTTVREIGDAAGILSGSLYHHFCSKDEMVIEILRSYVDDLLERNRDVVARFGDDPEKCLAALIRASLESVDRYRSACTIYQHDYNYLRALPRYGEIARPIRQVGRIWMQVLTDGATRGVFRSDIDPRLLQFFARDAITNAVHWFPNDDRYDLDTVAEACAAVFLQGVRAPACGADGR
jgi:AcrR family transcriptional regulator